MPKNGNDYDWAGLTACVAKVKEQFPEERQVTVTADPLIQYRYLVQAMDAIREKDTEELFPEVLISAGVR